MVLRASTGDLIVYISLWDGGIAFFRFRHRLWLFLLVYLVVLWKYEIKWSFSATGTSRLVRRKLQVCGNTRKCLLIFWNAATLVKLDVRTAMAVAFMVGTVHRDTSQKTIICNCFTSSCLNRNRRPFLAWLVVVSVVCCLHRFIVKLGVLVRLRGHNKLIVQHLVVSENLGEEVDQTVV